MVTGSNPVRRTIGSLILENQNVVMVDVAQLVEPRIVIPVVAGSNPVIHPTTFKVEHRSMAQFGSAPGLGPGGRRFESYCSDHLS